MCDHDIKMTSDTNMMWMKLKDRLTQNLQKICNQTQHLLNVYYPHKQPDCFFCENSIQMLWWTISNEEGFTTSFMHVPILENWKIPHDADLIHDFEISHAMESLDYLSCPPLDPTPFDVTLFAVVPYPKDPDCRRKWLKDEEFGGKFDQDSNMNWRYDQNQQLYKKLPLCELKNVTGRFRFFDGPLPIIALPFLSISISIKRSDGQPMTFSPIFYLRTQVSQLNIEFRDYLITHTPDIWEDKNNDLRFSCSSPVP